MIIQLATATGPHETEVEILFDQFGHTFVGHWQVQYHISEMSTGRMLVSDVTKFDALSRAERFLEKKGEMFFKEILKRHPVLNAVAV